jgi:hypothetical protein
VYRGWGRTEDVDRVAGEWPYLEPVLCPACHEAGGSTAGRRIHEEEWQ